MIEKTWDAIYAANEAPWGTAPRELVVEVSRRLSPPKRILDLGCGSGRDAFYLHQRGHRVTAVDISTVAIKTAAGSCTQAENPQFIVGDFCSFLSAASAESFDGVVSMNALNHAGDAFFDTLADVQRVLRPGGVLALSLFADDDEEFNRNKRIAPRTFESIGGAVRLVAEHEIISALSNYRIEVFKKEQYLGEPHAGASRSHRHSFFRILALLRQTAQL